MIYSNLMETAEKHVSSITTTVTGVATASGCSRRCHSSCRWLDGQRRHFSEMEREWEREWASPLERTAAGMMSASVKLNQCRNKENASRLEREGAERERQDNGGGQEGYFVGCNSADDANEDADEHTDDKTDDDHELVILRQEEGRVTGSDEQRVDG